MNQIMQTLLSTGQFSPIRLDGFSDSVKSRVDVCIAKEKREIFYIDILLYIDAVEGKEIASLDLPPLIDALSKLAFEKSLGTPRFLFIVETMNIAAAKTTLPENSPCIGIDYDTEKIMLFDDLDPYFLPYASLLEQTVGCKDFENNQRFSFVTTVLVIINVLIFLYMDWTGNPTSPDYMASHGGLSWQYVISNGEYWRLITYMFLHYGVYHLFNNMVSLWLLGDYLEKLTGRIRLFIIYFLTGIIAGLISIGYNMQEDIIIISVGASGAIFGIMGGLLFTALLYRKMGHVINYRRILFMSLISLYIGFASQGVDNAAHVGGFLSGICIAALLHFGQKITTH